MSFKIIKPKFKLCLKTKGIKGKAVNQTLFSYTEIRVLEMLIDFNKMVDNIDDVVSAEIIANDLNPNDIKRYITRSNDMLVSNYGKWVCNGITRELAIQAIVK